MNVPDRTLRDLVPLARRLAWLPLLFALSCATHYQPRAYAGGYTDKRLAPDTFEVTFEANGFTDDATTRTYLLYRCAELTKANGFDHFVILDGQDLTALSLSLKLEVVTKPAHSATIRFGAGPKPNVAGAHLADDVLRELGPQIKR